MAGIAQDHPFNRQVVVAEYLRRSIVDIGPTIEDEPESLLVQTLVVVEGIWTETALQHRKSCIQPDEQ